MDTSNEEVLAAFQENASDIAQLEYVARELNRRIDEYESKNKTLQAELAKHRWIPVEERLPELYVQKDQWDIRQYLVSDGEIGWITTWKANGIWWEQHSRTITHWMPVPVS